MAAPSLFWDQLLQLIDAGRVVPIVGRDLLTTSLDGRQVDLYPLLAERLAEYLQVSTDELPAGGEINAVACRYLDAGGQLEELYPALMSVTPSPEELAIPAPPAQLAAITPIKLFLSTTFDPLLARALDQARFGGQPKTESLAYSPEKAQDLPVEAARLDRPVVYHLFGRLSPVPLEYALTQEDTLEFLHSLQSEANRPELLFDELGRANLILLGSSFGGWLARMFLRMARRQRLLEVRGRTDYLADPRVSDDEGLVLFLRHFSSRTQIYKQGDAASFVEELSRRWTELHPEAAEESIADTVSSSTPTEPRGQAVFLSYASEDRESAISIRDALEGEHLTVFFDRDDLKTGDDWDAKLRKSIAASALFVMLISENTLTPEARYFRDEWNEALGQAARMPRNRRFLVPVVVDSTSEQNEALPEELSRVQWTRLSDGLPTPEFVADVVRLYREYQKLQAGAS